MNELTEDRVRELINETVGTVPVLAKYLQKQFWSDLPYASAQVPSFDGTNLKFKPTSLAAGHDAITMSGTPDYITLSGQDIVRGSIDLAADVTGDLPYANLTPSANASRVLARTNASAGDWQECTLSTGLTMNGTILTVAYDSANFTGTNWTDLTDGGATTLHSHAGGSGHTIRENGVDMTARTGLNVIDTDAGAGLLTDDAVGDETEVNLTLYVLLTGRVGGQSIIGGTGSGENVTVRGTSHATAGRLVLNTSKLQMAASPNNAITDSGGVNRILVATATPYVSIQGTSGGMKIQGSLGLGNTTPATDGVEILSVAHTVAAPGGGTQINVVNISSVITTEIDDIAALGGVGQFKMSDLGTVTYLRGLNFTARHAITTAIASGSSASITDFTAAVVGTSNFDVTAADTRTVNITTQRGLGVLAPTIAAGTGVYAVTDYMGIELQAIALSSASFITFSGTLYGLKMGAMSGTSLTGGRVGVEIGDVSGNVAINKDVLGLLIKPQTTTAVSGTGKAFALLYGSTATPLAAIDTAGAIKSYVATGAGVGYGTGAGGTVTQLTSKATGVTLNKVCGQITMHNAALAADTTVSFTLTNSAVAATDIIIVNHVSGGTAGSYLINAQCGAGTASINVRNITAGSLSEAIVIAFAVIKGVTA